MQGKRPIRTLCAVSSNFHGFRREHDLDGGIAEEAWRAGIKSSSIPTWYSTTWLTANRSLNTLTASSGLQKRVSYLRAFRHYLSVTSTIFSDTQAGIGD
jgi:hypothetical protein